MSVIIPEKYWKYCQEEGTLFSPEGEKVGDGYSGHDVGRNNPMLENSPNVGPIPKGVWEFAQHEEGKSFLGPIAIQILPVTGTMTYDRTGFFLHGEEEGTLDHTRNAQHCCVIVGREAREKVLAHRVKMLVVVENKKIIP